MEHQETQDPKPHETQSQDKWQIITANVEQQLKELELPPTKEFKTVLEGYLEYLRHIEKIAIDNQGNYFPPSTRAIIENIQKILEEIKKDFPQYSEIRYDKKGRLRVRLSDGDLTISEKVYYFNGDNGIIVFSSPSEKESQANGFLFRGVGGFCERRQQCILVRYNPKISPQELREWWFNSTTLDEFLELINKTEDPQTVKKTLEIFSGKPIETLSLSEIKELLTQLHLYTERGGASFVFDIFVATSPEISSAKNFCVPLTYEPQEGIPGILILTSDKNTDVKIGPNSEEIGIVGEIPLERIIGFIPAHNSTPIETINQIINRTFTNQAQKT